MNEKLHICFISEYAYNYLKPGKGQHGGGAERQIHLIGKELKDRGHKITFLVRDYDKPYREEIDGFEILKSIPKSTGISCIPVRLFKLFNGMNNADADIYYVRGSPLELVLTLLCSKVLRKPVIYSVANDRDITPEEGEGLFRKIFRELYKRGMKKSNKVIAQKKRQQEILREQHSIRSKIIPNGYPPVDESKLTSTESRKFVLWVGRLDKHQKRPELFLELAQQLPDSNFVMIGGPSHDEEWNSRIRQQAAKIENLNFVGFVPPDEIEKYYRKASILVNTSTYEGFPNTFLEAWRVKTPVVTMNDVFSGDYLNQEPYIYSDNLEELIREIKQLEKDIERRERLGEEGRELLERRFTIERISSSLVDVCEDICT